MLVKEAPEVHKPNVVMIEVLWFLGGSPEQETGETGWSVRLDALSIRPLSLEDKQLVMLPCSNQDFSSLFDVSNGFPY